MKMLLDEDVFQQHLHLTTSSDEDVAEDEDVAQSNIFT